MPIEGTVHRYGRGLHDESVDKCPLFAHLDQRSGGPPGSRAELVAVLDERGEGEAAVLRADEPTDGVLVGFRDGLVRLEPVKFPAEPTPVVGGVIRSHTPPSESSLIRSRGVKRLLNSSETTLNCPRSGGLQGQSAALNGGCSA